MKRVTFLSGSLLNIYHWIGKCMWRKSIFLCKALDFSDDEKEKEAKQRKKSQIQGRKKFRSEFNEPGELNVIYSHFFIFIYICISSSVIKVRETSGGLLFMLWHLTSIRGITHSMRCGGRVTGDIHWWFFRLMDVKMAPRGKRQTKPW